jgi:predicted nucleic acid-binding protein
LAKTYTVDASVFLSAFNPYEQGHQASNALLAHLQQHALPIIVPTLLLPEVVAAISRGRQDEALARGFALGLTRLPHLVMVPLDETLARQAMDVAAGHRLRGSDAIITDLHVTYNAATR